MRKLVGAFTRRRLWPVTNGSHAADPSSYSVGIDPMRIKHWTANMGHWCWSTRADVFDDVTRAFGRLIAAAGALGIRAPLRNPDDPWQLEVLSHPHGPRVLKARIVAPDGLPVSLVAVAEGDGAGPRRAWRETVAAASWFIEGCDPGDFRNPPDGPWVISAWESGLEAHWDAVKWLGDVERYIGWAFLDSLEPMASA